MAITNADILEAVGKMSVLDLTAFIKEIEEKFDLGYHTKHVDTIFKRVFG